MLLDSFPCRRPVILPTFVQSSRWPTVWGVLINLPKCPTLQWWAKWKSDLESLSATRSQPKVPISPLVGPIKFQWNRPIRPTIAAILLTDRQTDRQHRLHNFLNFVGTGRLIITKHQFTTLQYFRLTQCCRLVNANDTVDCHTLDRWSVCYTTFHSGISKLRRIMQNSYYTYCTIINAKT